MSRKNNTKHPERGRSRYKERLAARGVKGPAVRMVDVEVLRRRQDGRAAGLLWDGKEAPAWKTSSRS